MSVSDKALAQAFREARAMFRPDAWHGDVDFGWIDRRARELDATYQPNINSGEVDNGGDAKGGALLTNPHTGTPRDYRDVESDPTGILIHKSGDPIYATPPAQAAEAVERVGAKAGCTCPSGDGSLRWPCPQHPPAKCHFPDCVKAGATCVENATCATPFAQAVVVRALENAAVDHGIHIAPTSLIYMARAAIAAMRAGE